MQIKLLGEKHLPIVILEEEVTGFATFIGGLRSESEFSDYESAEQHAMAVANSIDTMHWNSPVLDTAIDVAFDGETVMLIDNKQEDDIFYFIIENIPSKCVTNVYFGNLKDGEITCIGSDLDSIFEAKLIVAEYIHC